MEEHMTKYCLKPVINFLILGLFLSCSTKIYTVANQSMQNTISIGDHILVKLAKYQTNEIKRGDIVMIKVNIDNDNTYTRQCKRIIGLPGESIKILNDKVYINDKELDENYVYLEPMDEKVLGITEYSKYNIPDNCFFYLGDNRHNSLDSRQYGPVKIENIIGKVIDIIKK
jgi:signal peptidase I